MTKSNYRWTQYRESNRYNFCRDVCLQIWSNIQKPEKVRFFYFSSDSFFMVRIVAITSLCMTLYHVVCNVCVRQRKRVPNNSLSDLDCYGICDYIEIAILKEIRKIVHQVTATGTIFSAFTSVSQFSALFLLDGFLYYHHHQRCFATER